MAEIDLTKILANMKSVTFVVFLFIFICVTFGIFHARLTNENLGLALMILLISLFTDLKKFNFWGLTGEKIDKDVKNLQGKSGVNEKAVPKPTAQQVIKAETVELESPLQLNESVKGNFLTVSYELERIVRLATRIVLGKEASTQDTLIILQSKKLLKSTGVEQIEVIRKIKNILLNGKDNEVDESTIVSATDLASELYTELSGWLKNSL